MNATTTIDVGSDGLVVQLWGPTPDAPTVAFAPTGVNRREGDELRAGRVFCGATMADDRATIELEGTWERRGGTRLGEEPLHWVRVDATGGAE